jgi:hypothetical protein
MIKKFESYNPFTDKNYDIPDISYVGKIENFININEIENKEDLIKKKDDLINFLSDKDENKKLNEFKRKSLIKKLNLIFLYIQYYEYFENKFGKKTYRFIGNDIDSNMKEDVMTVKASKMESLFNNYGYDGGFVEYWSFSDSILFKTIKRLKII